MVHIEAEMSQGSLLEHLLLFFWLPDEAEGGEDEAGVVQVEEHARWLSKNVLHFIDLFITVD